MAKSVNDTDHITPLKEAYLDVVVLHILEKGVYVGLRLFGR